MTIINQNLEEVEVQKNIELLKNGWYDAIINNSRVEDKPKGLYVTFDLEIIGYPNHVYDGMSLGSEYGLIKLKTLASKVLKKKVDFVKNTEDFHGKYVKIKVSTKYDPNEEYDPRNVVKAYEEYDGENENNNIEDAKAPWEK